jgi:sugar lactone lactonase YvrE
MSIDRPRLYLTVVLAGFALTGCKDDPAGEGDGSEGADTTSGADDDVGDPTGSPTSASGASMTTEPPDCIPGDQDCECLDGQCIGNLSCVDAICVPGPLFQPDDDEEPLVLAGLVVPVNIDVTADEFTWTQVDGPETVIIGEGPSVLVPVPPDAAVGDIITLRINATRNTVQASFDWHITVREAVFENFLEGITSTEELGNSEGLDFDDNGNMWVVSTEGFISRFGTDMMFQSRLDVPGQPVGARFGDYYMDPDGDPIEVLFIANAMTSAIEGMTLSNQTLLTISDTVDGGGSMGTVNFVLPDGNGNVFASNRLGGQIFRYDVEDGVTRLFLDMAGENPNALSFGPDANVLYVGTLGQVVRVGVLPDEVAAEPSVYLDFAPPADGLEVDGLAFDEGGNLYVGVPNSATMYVARFVGDGATEPVRTFSDVGAGFSFFVSLRFGRGGFSESALYWTQLGDRTVGRLETGLRSL